MFLHIPNTNKFRCHMLIPKVVSSENQLPGVFEFKVGGDPGKWLKDQKIRVKTYITRRTREGTPRTSYILEFYNIEDAMAFKLRWA